MAAARALRRAPPLGGAPAAALVAAAARGQRPTRRPPSHFAGSPSSRDDGMILAKIILDWDDFGTSRDDLGSRGSSRTWLETSRHLPNPPRAENVEIPYVFALRGAPLYALRDLS